jgi:hypothetical protein
MKYMIQVRFNGADAVIRGLPGDEQNKITAEGAVALGAAPGCQAD